MRKLGITVGIIVVLIIIALLVAPRLINVNQFRGRIVTELQQKLGRPVSLGQLHLSLLPPAVTADNPVVGEDPNFHSTHAFAQAQELDVHVAFWPLLSKHIEVSSLELKRPQIELIRNAQGVWNFSTIGQEPNRPAVNAAPAQPKAQTQPQPAQQQAGNQQPGSAPNNLQVNDLKITDGQVAVTDYQKKQPRALYDHIDLHLANFAPDKPFDLTLAAHLPGGNSQEIKLDGIAGPINSASPAETPVKADVNLQNVSISGLQKFLNSPALAGDDAVISGKAHVENAANNFGSTGDLKFDDVKLHDHSVGYPITANYSVASDGKQLRIDKGDLKLGSTPIAISGTVNTQATPAAINLKLNARDVSIQEIARLAAAAGYAFNPNMNVSGRLNADLTAQGPASLPAVNGSLDASNLEISGKDLPQSVKANAIQLALTPKDVRSNKFTATTGSTSLSVQFALANYTGNSPSVDADIATQNANLAEFLNIAKAYGISAVEGMSGSGTLTLNAHATGPVHNSAAMNFSGNGQLTNAQIKPPSLTQPLKIRNANLRFSQNSAIIENLNASLGSTNASGTLSASNFANPNVQFTLAADKINVDELEQIAGNAPANQNQKKTAENFWSIVPRADAATTAAPGIIEKMSGGGNVAIGQVIYNGLQLSDVKSKVTLDRGLIRLDPTTAQLYGGQETGAIVIDSRPTPMTYTVNAKLAKVDANQLLSSVSSLKQTLYGLLNADANTNFSSTPGGDIAKSLNGTAALNLANGKLAHIDMLYQLANIGKFLGTGNAISQKGFTNLVKLTGNFNIKNGVAETNNLQAVIDGGTLGAVGAVNLADQSLNMKITAILDKAMTQSVGGTNIGGYMQTALANKNGEMVMPILVTGSFSNPHFAPDVQQIAKMRLQNLLPTSANPNSLSSGVLGQILGGNKGGGQGQQNNPLQGVLGKITGNQQQQGMPQSDQSQQKNQQQTQQQQNQQQKPNWQNILNGVLNKNKNQQQNQQPPPQQPH